MKRTNLFIIPVLALLLLCGCTSNQETTGTQDTDTPKAEANSAIDKPEPTETITTQSMTTPTIKRINSTSIQLPEPRYDSETSVEEAMKNRRSVRAFTDEPISIGDVSQLLWAAQGITSESGQRTAPSAQRLYPLQVYLLAFNVEGLNQGVYHYVPQGHVLEIVSEGGEAEGLTTAPAAFVITIDLEKKPGPRPSSGNVTVPLGAPPGGNMTTPAGNGSAPSGAPKEASAETIRSWYYAETGHAAQNMYLETESLNLSMVTQAAMDNEKMIGLLKLQTNLTPYYFIPVGHGA